MFIQKRLLKTAERRYNTNTTQHTNTEGLKANWGVLSFRIARTKWGDDSLAMPKFLK